MKQRIAHIALVVNDYDEAIDFYVNVVGFVLKEDTTLSPGKRWVIVTPPGAQECSLLLAKASNEQQATRIGNQTGGRVFLFLHTDDFWRDYNRLIKQQVEFVREPVVEEWGTVAVFKDLYGNQWDLIQPSTNNKGAII
jgi:catechol 2,3-dioxygenase-like lactoylglutathione lyase family enzyme